jgi:hypothetical protein
LKTSTIAASLAAALVLAGCAHSGPDYAPIGEGLKSIAVALVAFGVVGALADLIRADNKPPPRPKPRKPRGDKPTERR